MELEQTENAKRVPFSKLYSDKIRGKHYKYKLNANIALVEEKPKEDLKPISASPRESIRSICISSISAFIGIAIVSSLHFSPDIPVQFLAMSFGAASVLLYAKPSSELASPRNAFFGQVFSAIIGCSWRALFNWIYAGNESQIFWLIGSLSVSCSIFAMHLTRTIHPPGGATALAAATIPRILAWKGFQFVLFPITSGTLILITIALITNNLLAERYYPPFWIS
jgi:CBS-domain-containing membrane protein